MVAGQPRLLSVDPIDEILRRIASLILGRVVEADEVAGGGDVVIPPGHGAGLELPSLRWIAKSTGLKPACGDAVLKIGSVA